MKYIKIFISLIILNFGFLVFAAYVPNEIDASVPVDSTDTKPGHLIYVDFGDRDDNIYGSLLFEVQKGQFILRDYQLTDDSTLFVRQRGSSKEEVTWDKINHRLIINWSLHGRKETYTVDFLKKKVSRRGFKSIFTGASRLRFFEVKHSDFLMEIASDTPASTLSSPTYYDTSPGFRFKSNVARNLLTNEEVLLPYYYNLNGQLAEMKIVEFSIRHMQIQLAGQPIFEVEAGNTLHNPSHEDFVEEAQRQFKSSPEKLPTEIKSEILSRKVWGGLEGRAGHILRVTYNWQLLDISILTSRFFQKVETPDMQLGFSCKALLAGK